MYWSVIAYVRWWLGVDSTLCGLVDQDDSRLTASTMAAIALPYNVARGLPPQKDELACERVVAMINESVKSWSRTLPEKARHCQSLAADLKKEGLVNSHQVSAISKLIWFLKPNEWTLFDRFAADGMQIGKHLPASEKMIKFYEKLHSIGFEDANRGIDEIISGSPWCNIPSERIIDTYLMRRGGLNSGIESEGALHAFVSALPSQPRSSLIALADDIGNKFSDFASPISSED